MGFEEDPLDLIDNDADEAVEMCLFFDEDDKKKQTGSNLPSSSSSGCCVIFLVVGALTAMTVWGSNYFLV
jgi:hypothetical protein